MRTANPALNQKIFANIPRTGDATDVMTIQGTVNKTALLLVFVLLTASLTWRKFFRTGTVEGIVPWMIGGMILGLIFALITIFKKNLAPVTAPIYALCEGFF